MNVQRNVSRKKVVKPAPLKSPRSRVLLHDPVLLEAIYKIRAGDASDALLDSLSDLIGNRKIILRYYTDTETKYIFLSSTITWKLRSLFIHVNERHISHQSTTEYMRDVFVDSVYSLELYEIMTTCSS